MQESRKNSLCNEIITCVFAVLLAIMASYLSANSQIEEGLVHSIWITNGLVIMSLFFRYFFQLLFQEKLIKHVPYFGILAPILFWLSIIYVPIYITVVCTVIGIIGFVINSSNLYKNIFSIYYLIIPFIYFIIIGSEAWNMHRTTLPDHHLVMQSQTGSDITFFSAITSMLKTYDICSIGIDGLIGVPYHYGTYYFLAFLSSVLDLNSLYINSIIAPLIFLPLALFIMLEILTYFKHTLSSYYSFDSSKLKIRDHIIFATILTTLTNAPLGLPFVANLSFFTSPFQIDSQLLANLLLGIIIVIISHISSIKNENIFISIFFLICIQSILCMIKAPASHLSLLIIVYTCIRYSLQRTALQNKLWFLTLTVCAIATFYINSLITPETVNQEGVLTIGFFTLWKSEIAIRNWQWIYISNGFYTIASFVLIALILKKTSAFDIITKFKNSRFSILEIFAVLTFTAISLSAVFDGSLSIASTYYMDTAKFLSLILFVSCLSILFSRINAQNHNLKYFLKTNSPIRVVAVLSMMFILFTGSGISLKGWERTFNKHIDSNLENATDTKKIQKKVSILKTLLHLSKTYQKKSETCLWIPKTNNIFWNELALPKSGAFLPLWAVALSEMALIDGYPLSNNLDGMFGYGCYSPDSTYRNKNNIDLGEIMSSAKKKGFKYLIVLWDHKTYDYHKL